MRARVLAVFGALVVAAAGASLLTVSVAGQTPAAAAKTAKPAAAKFRTPEGYPDLQGLYNTATLTPLERADPAKLVMTDAEAAAIERTEATRIERAARPSDGGRDAPPVGGDGSTGAAGNVGGYNNFWIDRGTSVITVDGQRRTSLVVDPPSGRVPQVRAEAMRRNAAAVRAAPTSDAPENLETTARGAYDNPEQRPLGERCILGFGSTSGPPSLPVLYNNFKQIVQTKDHVMILVEMNHDARIIPLNKPHAPASIRKWIGDSVARYEGDALVIETTNFTNKTRFRGASDNLKVTERFWRADEKTIMYRFTVEDPTTWATPWTGEYPWVAAEADDRLYEYACHEGNYALGDILRGERLLEAEAAAVQKK
ncbi:MAG: hypothetical protein A3H97_10065 [Acidobacteria bacterium RIFCSPLOWO2_02_FULL_65_29]|nr:MAG: hypothetical protein A3H97_10065 [Acidobacteria bacterium RIFCSPLOWO2_02_FULL_65_29]